MYHFKLGELDVACDSFSDLSAAASAQDGELATATMDETAATTTVADPPADVTPAADTAKKIGKGVSKAWDAAKRLSKKEGITLAAARKKLSQQRKMKNRKRTPK